MEIYCNMILIYEYYTFKPVLTNFAFKYDANILQWTLLYKLSIDDLKPLFLRAIVTSKPSKMNEEVRKYMYKSRNGKFFQTNI